MTTECTLIFSTQSGRLVGNGIVIQVPGKDPEDPESRRVLTCTHVLEEALNLGARKHGALPGMLIEGKFALMERQPKVELEVVSARSSAKEDIAVLRLADGFKTWPKNTTAAELCRTKPPFAPELKFSCIGCDVNVATGRNGKGNVYCHIDGRRRLSLGLELPTAPPDEPESGYCGTGIYAHANSAQVIGLWNGKWSGNYRGSGANRVRVGEAVYVVWG